MALCGIIYPRVNFTYGYRRVNIMIHEPQLNSGAYDRYFLKLRQASHIEGLHNEKRVKIKLSLSHKAIYTYMLSMFKYYQSIDKECYLSSERVAAEVGVSVATYRNVKRDFVEVGLLYSSKRTSKNNIWLATHISYMVDVDCSPSHKYIKNDVLKSLDKARWDNGNITSWTSEQAIHYNKNKLYEDVTGVYLEGDKTECILYEDEDYFNMLE